jgi:hypothetical protein
MAYEGTEVPVSRSQEKGEAAQDRSLNLSIVDLWRSASLHSAFSIA